MSALDPVKLKAQKTYNLASDYFDAPPLGFWGRYGRQTVERLTLHPGASVLDAACGAGASALPAAEAVGPTGWVTGVDLADQLLARAREKAKQQGLANIEFLQADMTELGYPDAHFDAVICVFGVFFVPNMESLVAKLWRMVRPGGKLAVTTWGPRIFAPAYEVWNEAVRKARPDLYAAYHPWDRITTPDAVRTLFRSAGVPSVDVEPEDGYQLLASPGDFWTIVLGSGLRWTVDQLGPDRAEQVKQVVLEWLAAHKVDRVETNVIYAVATRGPKGEGRRRK
jgi:ubiquinone/menaquinone biosynthesis C-methylase UbiE